MKCPDLSSTQARGSGSRRNCTCNPGFSTRSRLDYAASACQPCPPHVVCPGRGQPEFAMPGYALVSLLPTAVEPCVPRVACEGGPRGTCGQGYEGPRCGKCARGFHAVAAYCVDCDGTSTLQRWLYLGLALLGYLLSLALLIFRISPPFPVPRVRAPCWSWWRRLCPSWPWPCPPPSAC